MAKTERIYNIPLRKEFQKAPLHKRTKKAISALKAFLVRHMKSDNIKLGRNLNNKMWERGIRNPPHHIKVTAVKEDDGTVKAELFGFKYEEPTLEEMEKQLEKELEKEEKKADKAEKTKKEEKKPQKEKQEKTEKAEEKPKKSEKEKVQEKKSEKPKKEEKTEVKEKKEKKPSKKKSSKKK